MQIIKTNKKINLVYKDKIVFAGILQFKKKNRKNNLETLTT